MSGPQSPYLPPTTMARKCPNKATVSSVHLYQPVYAVSALFHIHSHMTSKLVPADNTWSPLKQSVHHSITE